MKYTEDIAAVIANASFDFPTQRPEQLAGIHQILHSQRSFSFRKCLNALHALWFFRRKSPLHLLIGVWQAESEHQYLNGKWECFYTYKALENVYVFDHNKQVTTIYTQDNVSEREVMDYKFFEDMKIIKTHKITWFVHQITKYELDLIEIIKFGEESEFVRTIFRKIK